MAGFHTKTFLKHDDYMTPKYAWENIQQYIPKDKIIWEAFMGDGKSGQYLTDLGYNVIHNDNDLMPRLKELDKPFILILPCSKICTQYFRENFKDTDNPLQIIIPRKRIQFVKNGNDLQNKCNFDCFYYCYKMNLERDIIWLEN